ncbi:hypothetical protein LTR36_000593 [Oleoguttula mirabilis]|uniref:Serine/threonine-protein kinase MEC1 n=1 Tax=Oleoguttula mirabilis TaxID=1507867 RepID=A0AAV9JPX7_9PEZI|nr:hypothetical protein LTR36_000593 [Oleoguttula mirabilis]
MARRVPTANGAQGDGAVPPPSTLAAQIVHNQTRPETPQQNGENPTFPKLLHAILNDPAAAQETGSRVNVQLIDVVAEAGLAPLTLNNPFAQYDTLIPQANDSLAVIEKTIKRQPRVLLTPIREDGPPLALPLFARLIAICGRPKCQDLPVARLLGSLIRALTPSTELWQSAEILQQVCQATVDETLSALEAPAVPGASLTIRLPPTRNVATLWPQSESAIASPYLCQVDISEHAEAFMLALLLSAIPSLEPYWRREAHLRLSKIVWPLRDRLEKAHQWEHALGQLFLLPDNVIFLRLFLRSMVQDSKQANLPTELQRQLAVALVRMLRDLHSVTKDVLLSEILSLAASDSFGDLHEDLKISLVTWLARFVPDWQLPDQVLAIRDALRQDNVMADGEFHLAFRELCVFDASAPTHPRRRKRRRITLEAKADQLPSPTRHLTRLLTGIESDDLMTLAEQAPETYRTLTEDERCRSWQLLTMVSENEPALVIQIVGKILGTPELQETKRVRVLTMFTVRACVQRLSDQKTMDLGTTQIGQLCLSSLHSSIRELRIAAGQCLPYFLRDNLPDSMKTNNRRVALEYLRSLSERNVASEQETLIGAWGEVGLVCGDRELNLVLLRLVDYIGHTNSLISAVASAELEKLAAARKQTMGDLFAPFWGTIALSVVQDLHSRPQKAQQLCDLLGTDINHFLVNTQRDTVPTLVLTKKSDILERIASARSTSIHELCLQPVANRAATLALLLSQPASDVEEAAVECLAEVAPSFRGVDLAIFIRPDPISVACEMLKHSGDAPEQRKLRLYHAIQTFANLAERRPGQSRAHSKSSRTLTEFFDTHILGIMAHYSTFLEGLMVAPPLSEKLRVLNAIRDMIRLTKSHASIALPQIRACLQSAMERPELCEAAFSAWLELLAVLAPEDTIQMLDQTFALVVRRWSHFSPELQEAAHGKIADLLKNHNKLVQECIMTLPSLKSIPLLAKFDAEIERLRGQESVAAHCSAFEKRLQDESVSIIHQALEELVPFLIKHQEFIHDSAVSEQPVPVLSALLRALLDVTTKYSATSADIADLCGKAIGIIGCLDPNRVEATRKQRKLLVLSNFEKSEEAVDWVITLLEEVLVKAFMSVTNARAQGFLAYVMQELFKFCNFTEGNTIRTRSSQMPPVQQRWMTMPEHVRITVTPFLTSRYLVNNINTTAPNRQYPGFAIDSGYSSWLRSLVFDLMWKGKGDNPKLVFPLLARLVRGHDLAIPNFILPYAMLNIVLGGTVAEVQGIAQELLAVLQCQPASPAQLDTVKQCSATVFGVLDYMTSWLQEKKRVLSQTRADAYRTGTSPGDFNEVKDMAHIEELERFLAVIPAEALATRAMECGSYARALFNWEQYIRQERSLIPSPRLSQQAEEMYGRLQSIYASIDDPDGLEGIGAHLSFLTEEQQVIQHTKAGRWTAAQAWYELRLAEEPTDSDAQISLLNCLRESGQYAALLRYAQTFLHNEGNAGHLEGTAKVCSLAIEAQWMTGDMDGLAARVKAIKPSGSHNFDIGIGRLLVATAAVDHQSLSAQLSALRTSIAKSMTETGTNSLQACHGELMQLHALYEIEAINGSDEQQVARFFETSTKRLAALGSYTADKQYLVGLRRAIMSARSDKYDAGDVGSLWLLAARLARKAGNTHSAYNAVLQAYACGDQAAKLEEARLLWHEGHQRQAIQALQTGIDSGAFETAAGDMEENSESSERTQRQNMLAARAHLLLAKWLDASGQSQSKDMTLRYQYAAKNFQRWEKGHYYLGKHYNKLLEAEKALPKAKQSAAYLTGDIARSVVENLMRSIPFGNKYWHQTIPRILTLWLDLGMETMARARTEDQAVFDKRVKSLQSVNKQLQKYFERIPPYVFYTALPQMISRISHPHPEVWRQLSSCLTRIVAAHPSQALWSLLAVVRATDRTRAERGIEILNRLKDPKSKAKTDGTDVRSMITQGQKLSDGLLRACEQHVEPRKSNVSLSKDLGFNHKLAPSALVVPIEATLSPNLPGGADCNKIRRHHAFAQDKITIQSFADEVLVLSSLQRPRKIVARGSDGKQYGLLCKPKDDLRKDQRLMEFNGIINRALKRDPESSKRRLYIKTYAVTPLSEESGTLEWVEGIKPIRDILLNGYARKGIRPNYNDIRGNLNEACAAPEYGHLFNERVLSHFPPVLHEWFTETYTEPETWFAARLRYARTAAVMSMTGHVLGLGDRHGENILLEEGSGGVFHVDFNCLFDKGLTFEKPELVPFRLTHNMVDAMGPYGYEGPFRKSSELTLGLLRQNKDTLMTVLETFLYDPTTDFAGKRKRTTPGVPETPQEILDSVDGKLKGLLKGENVPLGVEGYVDALIREAVSPFNLASMYIGWCAFL